jgi:hypothetical protein
VIILDTLLLGGIKFILSKIAAAVDAELNDDTALKEELLEAQMRLEMGELSEEEFTRVEREILDAIRVVRERMSGAGEETGELKVTGIEASTWSDEIEDEDGPAGGRDR